MRHRGSHRTAPGEKLQRLRTPSPRRRRAQLGGLFTLCALATGSTAALLVVANAGVDLLTVAPMAGEAPAGNGLPPAADGSVGPSTPSRGPVFGWSPGTGRRPYVTQAPRWVDPSGRRAGEYPGAEPSVDTPSPGRNGDPLDVPENLAVPTSPGEGSAPPGRNTPERKHRRWHRCPSGRSEVPAAVPDRDRWPPRGGARPGPRLRASVPPPAARERRAWAAVEALPPRPGEGAAPARGFRGLRRPTDPRSWLAGAAAEPGPAGHG
jgi:hypothetical protein